MDLREIEEKADELAQKMLATEGRQERTHHSWALEGLHRLAQIKATVAHQKRMEAQDHQPLMYGGSLLPGAPYVSPLPAICGVQSPQIWTGERYVSQTCRVQAGHTGLHRSAQGAEWSEDVPAEPTKPAVDRLHELVSYGRSCADDTRRPQYEGDAYYLALGKAYDDMATKLEEILREGSL